MASSSSSSCKRKVSPTLVEHASNSINKIKKTYTKELQEKSRVLANINTEPIWLPASQSCPPSFKHDDDVFINESKYLLDPSFFGVRNPNAEFMLPKLHGAYNCAIPARNSWDWDRLIKVLMRGDVVLQNFVAKLARVKLCNRMGVPPDSDSAFSDEMPEKWRDNHIWEMVFSGV